MLETGHRGMERGTSWFGTRDQTVLDWTWWDEARMRTCTRRHACVEVHRTRGQAVVNAPGSWPGLTPRNDSTLVHSRQEPRARGSRPTNYATALSLAIHLSDLFRRTAISPFVPFEIERLLISRTYLHLIQREYENRIVWRRFYIVFQNKSRWSYGS